MTASQHLRAVGVAFAFCACSLFPLLAQAQPLVSRAQNLGFTPGQSWRIQWTKDPANTTNVRLPPITTESSNMVFYEWSAKGKRHNIVKFQQRPGTVMFSLSTSGPPVEPFDELMAVFVPSDGSEPFACYIRLLAAIPVGAILTGVTNENHPEDIWTAIQNADPGRFKICKVTRLD